MSLMLMNPSEVDSHQTVAVSGGTKRKAEAGEQPELKRRKRCVQFAENSHCRVLIADDAELSDDDKASTASSESNDSNDSLASEASKTPTERSFEVFVPTKQSDGPAESALVTNSLLMCLVRQGNITFQQVSCTLHEASSSGSQLVHPSSPPSSPPTPSSLPLSPISPNATAEVSEFLTATFQPECSTSPEACTPEPEADPERSSSPPARRPPLLQLCEQVYARLRFFTNRIQSSGRAPLLPSTAVMGPDFLPALRFLRAAIRDTAAAALRAQAEAGQAEAPTGTAGH